MSAREWPDRVRDIIDPAILWKTIQDDLPLLLPHLENLLDSTHTSSNETAVQ
jgi:uncharacterized protein with HEPN domain